METLRFKDDNLTLDTIRNVFEEIMDILPSIEEKGFGNNDPVDLVRETISFSDFAKILSFILDYKVMPDGCQVYELPARYIAKRTVKYAIFSYNYTISERKFLFNGIKDEVYVISRTRLLFDMISYVLEYSHRIDSPKAKKFQKHGGLKMEKNSLYGECVPQNKIKGEFDDYPSFIGSFMPNLNIPCDGDEPY